MIKSLSRKVKTTEKCIDFAVELNKTVMEKKSKKEKFDEDIVLNL